MKPMLVRAVLVALFLCAAPSCTDDPAPVARPSASPSVEKGRDGFVMTTVRVSSRSELVAEVNDLGFDDVLVLGLGHPVRVEHYTMNDLHVRSVYQTRFGEVRVFQSDDTGITAGASVTIRGIEGVRNGEGASWVERDYALGVNPLGPPIVRALRWVERS